MRNSAPAGCYGGWGSARMPIITTGNTGRRIITPKKEQSRRKIKEIYHRHKGVDGYRSMAAYLSAKGYNYSPTTIHKYMNTELGLHSIVRPKKPGTKPGKPHKIFDNKLNQDFHADIPNQKWCTDFTYLFLKNGDVVTTAPS